MAGAIVVECRDRGLREWVQERLSSWQLDVPATVVIRLHLLDSLPPLLDARPVFGQPAVDIHAGPPGDDVVIRWRLGDARARIHPTDPLADIHLVPAAAGDPGRFADTFLHAAMVFVLRRVGWQHVHGAIARDPRGRDWLLAGDARAGKSTTAALLARHGWAVGTDDLTFLRQGQGGIEALAPRVPIALRPEGAALLGFSGGSPAREGRKHAWNPEELGGSFVSCVRPAIIMFPGVGERPTRIAPLTPREALAELMRWSAWVALEPELAQLHLELLQALASQASAWRLTLADDLFAGDDLLKDLVP